jgi:hypothetical protein
LKLRAVELDVPTAELLRELIADTLRKKGELERIARRLRRVPQ